MWNVESTIDPPSPPEHKEGRGHQILPPTSPLPFLPYFYVQLRVALLPFPPSKILLAQDFVLEGCSCVQFTAEDTLGESTKNTY